MASPYRFLLAEVETFNVLAELDMNEWSYALSLQPSQQAGAFTGTISYHSVLATRENLVGGAKRFVFVEKFGVIVGSYLLWDVDPQPAAEMVSLAGAECWSYFQRRKWRTGPLATKYVGLDKLVIARAIVNNAQAQPSGDLGLIVGTEVGAPTTNFTINPWERPTHADLIDELSKGKLGFDLAVIGSWAGTTPQINLRLFHPRRGSTKDQVLEWESNVIDYSAPQRGSTKANVVDVMGEGAGAGMVFGTAQDANDLAEGLRLEATFDMRSQDDVSLLTARAEKRLGEFVEDVPAVTVTLKEGVGEYPQLPGFEPGDTVRLRIDDGLTLIDGQYRVTQIVVTPQTADGDEDQMSVTLVSERAFP